MPKAIHIDMIDKTVRETYEWLDDVERYVEGVMIRPADRYERTEALQALRGVLHALRDELSVDQNAKLAAQLPTLIRGIYFEGWNPPSEPIQHTSEDVFFEKITRAFAGYDQEVDPESIAQSVFAALMRRMPDEAWKISRTLPRYLRELWPE